MNNLLKKITEKVKNPKVLILIGIIGILLVFLSSYIPVKSQKSENYQSSISVEKYKNEIENSIKEIVKKISGDSNPTVVVTLESGVRYTYADTGETDDSEISGEKTNQNSRSSKRSYITVKDSNGSERALVVTENMPEVRGVAVICSGGENESISENIKNAVTAALNITSKRVYISGGNK